MANDMIVQRYIPDPMTLEGLKFDLRIYVVIVDLDVPQAYICSEGLARFCTESYQAPTPGNFRDFFRHLTNYSLNKNNTEFDSEKHKLRLKDVLRGELVSTSQTGKTYRKTAKQIWHEIEQIVVKTVFVVQP